MFYDNCKIIDDVFHNWKFEGIEFNQFIRDVPEFFYHIFAYYDSKRNKWINLKNVTVKSIKDIKILPNVLFTNEITLKVVLHFLCSSANIYKVFIHNLIQEYKPSYMIELFPFIVVIFQKIFNKVNMLNAINILQKIFRKKEGLKYIILLKSIMNNISNIVTEELLDKSKENLIDTLCAKMIKNNDFQTSYSQYFDTSMTLFHFHFKTDIFNWHDISDVTVYKSKEEFYLKIETNDLFSDLVTSLPMKNQDEAESIQFIMSAQMDLVNHCHCQSILKSYYPGSCVEQHWEIHNLLKYNHQSNRINMQMFLGEATKNFMGENFFLSFISLPSNKYVCLKTLHKLDKLQEFWDMWFKYQEWHHPFILKFYGVYTKSCGFFRESANGPLFFNVYENNQDFLFRDVLDVLNSIGSALDYLHRSLKQTHGNVNLKSIVKVDKKFKLSEPSINETNSEVMETIKLFGVTLEKDKGINAFLIDLFGLLLCIILIYFMNEELKDQQVSASLFLLTKCPLKKLIIQTVQSQSNVLKLLEDLYGISSNINESMLNEIVVIKDNKCIPKCIEIFIRDAKMFKVNEIKFSQLEIDENIIGQGHFSKVFKGKYFQSKDNYISIAAKLLKENSKDFLKIRKELFPSTFPHKNVLKSYGYCIENEKIYLITELGYSNLLKYIYENPPDNDEISISYCLQICEGMKFLSDERKFIHRDLAARNILVFKEKNDSVTLKISDFGLTIELKRNKSYYNSESECNRFWLPPDELNNGKFTVKTDIYSFGVVMWEIFSHGKEVNKFKKKASDSLPQKIGKIEISNQPYEIMNSCWSLDACVRPKDFSTLIQLLK